MEWFNREEKRLKYWQKITVRSKKEKTKKSNVKTDKSKKDVKNKRHFWKDFKAELKKVVWPTPKQLLNSTVAVITIVLVTALIVFVLDMGFEAINKHGINKLQAALQNNNTVAENTTSEENTDEASSAESTVEDTTNNAE